jgi:hypothetical protein
MKGKQSMLQIRMLLPPEQNSAKHRKSLWASLRRPGKTALYAAVLVFFIIYAKSSAAGVKIELDDDKWFHFGMKTQVWYQAVDEEEGATLHDFMVRRAYFYVEGQVAPNVTFFSHIGGDRLGQEGVDSPGLGVGSGFTLRDGWIAYSPLDELKIQAGRMYIPFARANGTESSMAMLILDMPCEEGGVRGKPFYYSKACRDDGVTLWGNIAEGLVQYRFGLFQGQQGDVNPDRNIRTAGRVSLSLFDPETNYYNKGNYLGDKKVLSFGAGFDRQADLQWAAGRPSEDYSAWTFDVFYDQPIGTGSATFEGAYLDIQNAQNRADASYYYAQGGILIPSTNKVIRVQPYVRFEKVNIANLPDTLYAGGGLNLFFKKHSLKLVFDLTNVSHGAGSADSDMSIFTVMFQATL